MNFIEMCQEYTKWLFEKNCDKIYNAFKRFESLNYIYITFEKSTLSLNVEVEFYENLYILETLNNSNIIQDIINELSSRFIFKINLTNKKRIKFNRLEFNEVLFVNKKPKIKYKENKTNETARNIRYSKSIR